MQKVLASCPAGAAHRVADEAARRRVTLEAGRRYPGMVTRIGICSGPHEGEIFLLDLATDARPPAEQWIDGLRHALERGSAVHGLGSGWHYCPRAEPTQTSSDHGSD